MMVIKPNVFSFDQKLVCALSTRVGGVSAEPFGMNLSYKVGDRIENVTMNRELFFKHMGIPLSSVAIPGQIHSDNIQIISESGEYPNCDGLITNSKNLFLVVTVADCIPIMLYDHRAQVCTAIHAGWRGTEKRILLKAIEILRSNYSTRISDLFAYLGPSARKCCYQIGEEVADKFDKKYIKHEKGTGLKLDLIGINVDILKEVGVEENKIEVAEYCTICNPSLFHSYRRDKDLSGRMMAVIGIKREEN
ncbi:MAG: peptidoglycan editing factor PgeF [Ignavibacteriales bacterium]|nr:peptidoglycan editing factor PgeF [Ignavibacteriales bacterium]